MINDPLIFHVLNALFAISVAVTLWFQRRDIEELSVCINDHADYLVLADLRLKDLEKADAKVPEVGSTILPNTAITAVARVDD